MSREYRALGQELRTGAEVKRRSVVGRLLGRVLRDLFGYRWAFRCTTDTSSVVILGHGWASAGYTAADIDPTARGVGWLIAEGGTPHRMKTAYLSDEQATRIAEHATRLHTRAALAPAIDHGQGAA